jgi:hypothetical protein
VVKRDLKALPIGVVLVTLRISLSSRVKAESEVVRVYNLVQAESR